MIVHDGHYKTERHPVFHCSSFSLNQGKFSDAAFVQGFAFIKAKTTVSFSNSPSMDF
jgi:hypothetical protein